MHDFGQQAVICQRYTAVQHLVAGVERACMNALAYTQLDRQAFTGNRRLVKRRAAFDNIAIQRHPFTRRQPDQAAYGNAVYRPILPAAILLLHQCHFRCHDHQAAYCITGTGQGARFYQLGQGKQKGHHGRFRPVANQKCTGDGNAHQRIDIEVTVEDGNPALANNRPANQQHTDQGRDQCPQGTVRL